MKKPAAKCPICTKPAKHAKRTYGDFSEITCVECGQFRISRTLLETIRQHGLVARRDAHGRAVTRAPYGAVVLVTTYDL